MENLFSPEVSDALTTGKPIVALESTVISHGLPPGANLETAAMMQDAVREYGSIPAVVAVFGGHFHLGIGERGIRRLADGKSIRKLSIRDLPIAYARRLDGATTVATTIFAAERVGIRVFSTGGIGGIHRGPGLDVSADLPALASTPIVVVCSGAKAILDLPATREWLETHGITVLGYECDEFPAFYSRSSGLSVDDRVDSIEEIVKIVRARNELGMKNAILVTVPVPEEDEIPAEECDEWVERALDLAVEKEITGRHVTPFLLTRIAKMSEGRTLKANVSLLVNNARIASLISKGCAEEIWRLGTT